MIKRIEAKKMKRRQFLATTTKATFSAALLSTCRLKAESPSNWKIGIYTRPWSEHDYRTALDAMVQAGYTYAGLMTSKKGLVIDVETNEKHAAQVGKEAKDRDLSILSVYGGQFYEDRSKKAAIRGLKKLIDNVHACGGQSLLLGGTGNKKTFNNYYNAVVECCDYALQREVKLTLKPHGGLNATGPECRKIIEKVDHPNFELWYDPGNIYYYSDGYLDPTKDVDTVADIIKGMCVKDFQAPKQVALTPGTGLVDFPVLFAKLKKSGFVSGPLVIECLDEGDLDTNLKQAKKAKRFLEKMLP